MMKDTTNPLQPRVNGTMDDIAAVIGFTAALRLCAWYGDPKNVLYVPETASEGHEIARLVGMPAFQRLVAEWGRQNLSVPVLEGFDEDRRYRTVRDLLRRELTPREIGPLVGLSARRIEQVKTHLENAGMLAPVIAGRKSAEEKAA